MTISILYFSGTGNSAWVATQLAARLQDFGETAELRCVEDGHREDISPDPDGMLGMVFPVHSSRPPSVFEEAMDSLPEADGTAVFAVTTAGFAAGDTAWFAVKRLESSGYRPFLWTNVIMGNNLHLPALSPLPVTPPDTMQSRRIEAVKQVNDIARRIHGGEPLRVGHGVGGRVLGTFQRALAGTLEGLTFSGFYTDATCTRCGWCVQHCPVGNIGMGDYGPVFWDRCIICMRCYSFCPTEAIQASPKTEDRQRFRRYKGPEGRRYPPG
jgi:ferredoxin